MSKDDVIDGTEYMMAVAKALDMPDEGINSLEISVSYGSPVIVRILYLREGTSALLEVMPPADVFALT